MARVVWTAQATRDMHAIWLYIARNSEANANLVSEAIYQAVTRLSDFPESGRILTEFEGRDIRQALVRPYRLIYRFDGDTVVIITVIHGARRISEVDLVQ